MEFPIDHVLDEVPNADELTRLKLSLASEGRELFDLSMINPDQACPRFMIDKLLEATVRPGASKYAVSRGVRKLREAFSLKYQQDFGSVVLNPESEVCVTLGAKDAFVTLFRALCSAGDKVLLPAPTYPAHLSATRLTGLDPLFYEISEGLEAALEQIENVLSREQDIRVLVLNFPNNPLGTLADENFFRELAKLVSTRNIWVINDFVYAELVYGAPAALSLLSCEGLKNQALEVYSLSKGYSVPGWRIAAVCGRGERAAQAIARVSRLKSHRDYGQFLPLQIAAAAGLSCRDALTASAARTYKGRSNLLVSGLTRLGWKVSAPQAGCSVWASPPAWMLKEGSKGLCLRLLEKTGIALTPGSIFGNQYDNFLRFALVLPEERLHRVLNLLPGESTNENALQL